jgi:hypothetical protein
MSFLYVFEARVPEFDAVFSVQLIHFEGGWLRVKFWDSSLE